MVGANENHGKAGGVNNMTDETLEARFRWIELVMRDGLGRGKHLWTNEEIGEAIGVGQSYAGQLTRRMKALGKLKLHNPDSRPHQYALPDVAESLPLFDGGAGYFGPCESDDLAEAEKLAEVDGVDSATFFHRAVEAYRKRREAILADGW